MIIYVLNQQGERKGSSRRRTGQSASQGGRACREASQEERSASEESRLRSSLDYELFGTRTTPSPKGSLPKETRVGDGLPLIGISPKVCKHTVLEISDPRQGGSRKPVFLYQCLTLVDLFRRVARVRRLKPEQTATIEVCIPDGQSTVMIDKGDAATYQYCLSRIHHASHWKHCGLEISMMTIEVNVIANEPAASKAFINTD